MALVGLTLPALIKPPARHDAKIQPATPAAAQATAQNVRAVCGEQDMTYCLHVLHRLERAQSTV
jgi:hypothetical protein